MSEERLTENFVQDSFHGYLKSSLTQAKAEKLLDADVLSSAEGDLMITGPALCLYFAALRCTTNPPSVPLPRNNKTAGPAELTAENCPPQFQSFLQVWSANVNRIQSLIPEHQHDLARLICNLEPLSYPPNSSLNGIAADLRAVAIEISMRRTFQERYQSDLQAAIDAGSVNEGSNVKAKFMPPPEYEPSSTSSREPSPQYPTSALPPNSPSKSQRPLSPLLLSPSPTRSTFRRRTPSPTFLSPDAPAIEFIRETLYASMGDVLERTPSLRRLLKNDPPRAYFSAVAFAILEVATTSVTVEGSVVGVLGTELRLEDCPQPLRPFMAELAAISRLGRETEEADNEAAMLAASRDQEIPAPIMERVKKFLEEGIGSGQGRRGSIEGRSMAFVNRINGLALSLTKLKPFRERQGEVFKVLGGIGS